MMSMFIEEKDLFSFVNSKENLPSRTVPLASFYDTRQGIVRMDYSQAKKIMMTVGTDRTIKVSFFLFLCETM